RAICLHMRNSVLFIAPFVGAAASYCLTVALSNHFLRVVWKTPQNGFDLRISAASHAADALSGRAVCSGRIRWFLVAVPAQRQVRPYGTRHALRLVQLRF